MKEDLNSTMEGLTAANKSFLPFSSIAEVKTEGKDLRSSLVDFILSQWETRMADDYTTSILTSQNSLEQSKFNK